MLQINEANEKGNNSVDQVEYQIFDENNDKVDISVYDTIEIPIEYKIKDTSFLKLDDALNFKNMGVDVFNLKDDFLMIFVMLIQIMIHLLIWHYQIVLVIYIETYPYLVKVVNTNYLIKKRIVLIVFVK